MSHESISGQFANLRIAARDAPTEPGVYIMRDENEHIIYVGKAKSLKSRVRSYFSGAKDTKTATLLNHARSIETIIVATEYDALLLENTLIKQHKPKYNINLKDGKTYPVVRITAGDFPRIFRTRTIIEDGSLYFGPFPNIQGVDTLLKLVEKLFPLRKCKSILMRSPASPETPGQEPGAGPRKQNSGPCMYYHIGRCMAPCCGKISAGEYRSHVDRVQKLLSGKTRALIVDLTAQMHKAAQELQFERASQLRNVIKAIEDLAGDNSSVVDHNPESRDYIAWAAEGVLTTFTVFSMRGGKITGRELFRTRSAADERESLEMFITSYYDSARPPPPKIYLQSIVISMESEDLAEGAADTASPYASLTDWFKAQFGSAPQLLTIVNQSSSAKKHHTAILAMTRQNALEDLRKRLKERGVGPALDELAKVLKLRSRPDRIEGFDIAHLDGKHPVASLITFTNGVPDRKNYRCFKLRSVIGMVDDFAAICEVVRRRYRRMIRERKELPNLVLIDGGIGQVNVAKRVMDELGMNSDVVGLAKRNEELWLPAAKGPVILPRQSEALKVLQFVRDETHRFATSFNQRLRSRDLFFPVLESIEGIGPKRAALIMKNYGTIRTIAASNSADIAGRCRISEASAKAVRAAAKLALEDRVAEQKRLLAARGVRRKKSLPSYADDLASEALSGESMAAERAPEYPAK